MDSIFVILGWIVMATLALAIARQLSEQNVFPYSEYSEGFSSPDPVKKTLTAQTCYEADYMSHSPVGGDYTQRTNNFKHAKPDNCSGPLEFVNKFY